MAEVIELFAEPHVGCKFAFLLGAFVLGRHDSDMTRISSRILVVVVSREKRMTSKQSQNLKTSQVLVLASIGHPDLKERDLSCKELQKMMITVYENHEQMHVQRVRSIIIN
jgi:hypothetical protein